MLTKEFTDRLRDVFTPYELVDYLDIDMDDLIERLEDVIEDNEDELNDYIGYTPIRPEDRPDEEVSE